MTSTSEREEYYTKFVKFSGKEEDWLGWEEKFTSRALSKGFYEVLTGEEEIPKSNQESLTEEQEAIKKKNIIGYNEMIMGVDERTEDGRRAFDIIRASKTPEYKYGNIKLAFEAMKETFEPKSGTVVSKLEGEFFNSKLKSGEDPDTFIRRMDNLRTKMRDMKSEISDAQFMRRILNTLTSEYETISQLLEEDIEEKKLTVDEMRKRLRNTYTRMKNNGSLGVEDTTEEGEEQALVASGNNGNFPITCFICGRTGHKSYQCPERNPNVSWNIPSAQTGTENSSRGNSDFRENTSGTGNPNNSNVNNVNNGNSGGGNAWSGNQGRGMGGVNGQGNFGGRGGRGRGGYQGNIGPNGNGRGFGRGNGFGQGFQGYWSNNMNQGESNQGSGYYGGGRGPFPGTCYRCGQPGHRAFECPNQNGAGNQGNPNQNEGGRGNAGSVGQGNQGGEQRQGGNERRGPEQAQVHFEEDVLEMGEEALFVVVEDSDFEEEMMAIEEDVVFSAMEDEGEDEEEEESDDEGEENERGGVRNFAEAMRNVVANYKRPESEVIAKQEAIARQMKIGSFSRGVRAELMAGERIGQCGNPRCANQGTIGRTCGGCKGNMIFRCLDHTLMARCGGVMSHFGPAGFQCFECSKTGELSHHMDLVMAKGFTMTSCQARGVIRNEEEVEEPKVPWWLKEESEMPPNLGRCVICKEFGPPETECWECERMTEYGYGVMRYEERVNHYLTLGTRMIGSCLRCMQRGMAGEKCRSCRSDPDHYYIGALTVKEEEDETKEKGVAQGKRDKKDEKDDQDEEDDDDDGEEDEGTREEFGQLDFPNMDVGQDDDGHGDGQSKRGGRKRDGKEMRSGNEDGVEVKDRRELVDFGRYERMMMRNDMKEKIVKRSEESTIYSENLMKYKRQPLSLDGGTKRGKCANPACTNSGRIGERCNRCGGDMIFRPIDPYWVAGCDKKGCNQVGSGGKACNRCDSGFYTILPKSKNMEIQVNVREIRGNAREVVLPKPWWKSEELPDRVGRCGKCHSWGPIGFSCWECRVLIMKGLMLTADMGVYEPLDRGIFAKCGICGTEGLAGEGCGDCGPDRDAYRIHKVISIKGESNRDRQEYEQWLQDGSCYMAQRGLILNEDRNLWMARTKYLLEQSKIWSVEDFVNLGWEAMYHLKDMRRVEGAILFETATMFMRRDESDRQGEMERSEYGLNMLESNGGEMVKSKSIWIADSGASTHMGNSDVGRTDVRDISSSIKVGNGEALMATKIGRKHVIVSQADGTTWAAVLEDYKYVPGLYMNLFSITKALANGWAISSRGTTMAMTKGDRTMTFDQKIKTPRGQLHGVKIISRGERSNILNEVALPAVVKVRKETLKEAHRILGHPGEGITRRTAKGYDWKVRGTLEVCEDCAIAKAKQKPISKTTETVAKEPGGRMLLDISSVKGVSGGGRRFWILAVDDATDRCWSIFVKGKGELSHEVRLLIKSLKSVYGIMVKIIRLDNAGENMKLMKDCEEEGLNIKFEFTSPNSPQYNGKVERKFATLYARMRAMISDCGLGEGEKFRLWCEIAKHATRLENIYIREVDNKSAYERFTGKKHWEFVNNLHSFGSMAVIAELGNRGTKAKLEDRGKVCMYIGYAENHTNGVHRFWNPRTNGVLTSRNVTWLGMNYKEWMKQKETGKTPRQSQAETVDVMEAEEQGNEGTTSSRTEGNQMQGRTSVTREREEEKEEEGWTRVTTPGGLRSPRLARRGGEVPIPTTVNRASKELRGLLDTWNQEAMRTSQGSRSGRGRNTDRVEDRENGRGESVFQRLQREETK